MTRESLALGRSWSCYKSSPSENEWYKAAYYDPIAGHYWKYATGTNTIPASAPPGSIPNTANVYGKLGYAATGSTDQVPYQNYLTDVGAYTASASPYGTFDQAGDVFEWNETVDAGSLLSRYLRGGAWDFNSDLLPSSFRTLSAYPADTVNDIGFRVATVPEPDATALTLLGTGLILALQRRRRTIATENRIREVSSSSPVVGDAGVVSYLRSGKRLLLE